MKSADEPGVGRHARRAADNSARAVFHAIEHEPPLLPFTVVYNGAPLLLTPVLASSAEADAELREVAVSLFHHVLPGVGRKFMRKLLADERARTILLMRSVEGA